MNRGKKGDLEAINQLLRGQLEAIQDQIADFLDEIDSLEQEIQKDDEEAES